MLKPYEILLRWKDDGTFAGGHTVRRDDVTGQLSVALPIGLDTDYPYADVAAEINAAALARNSELETHLATAQQTAADNAQALAGAQANIEELRAQLAAVAPPAQDAADALLTQLNEAYDTLIPTDLRVTFAPLYATVRVLVQAGRGDLAAGAISGTAVPSELEAAKAQFLAKLTA